MSDQPPIPEPQPAPVPDPKDPPVEKTFTQKELDEIVTREKAGVRRSADDAIAKQLGVTPAEAKRIIEENRAKEDSEKTEAQRAKEAADSARAAADQEKTAATTEKHLARIERALVRAGITDETKLNRVSRLVEVDADASPEEVTEAVTTLKGEMPELFGAVAPDPDAPPTDPKGSPPGHPSGDDGMARGAARAEKMAGMGRTYAMLEKQRSQQ